MAACLYYVAVYGTADGNKVFSRYSEPLSGKKYRIAVCRVGSEPRTAGCKNTLDSRTIRKDEKRNDESKGSSSLERVVSIY